MFEDKDILKLREEYLYLVCKVTEKYYTLWEDNTDEDKSSCYKDEYVYQFCYGDYLSVPLCYLINPSAPNTEAMNCSDQSPKENSNENYLVTSCHCSLDDTSSVGIVSVDLDSIYVPDFEVDPNDEGSLYGNEQGHSTASITSGKHSINEDSVLTDNEETSPASRHQRNVPIVS